MWLIALMAGWVMACGMYDYRSRRVPNHLMLLGLACALIAQTMRIGIGSERIIVPVVVTLTAWVLAFAFWLSGWWGAADAKFVMVLSLAFPDIWMLISMAGVNLVAGLAAFWGHGVSRAQGAEKTRIPAVPVLALGWLAWAGIAWWAGR